jgi:hypothetical protein
MFEREKQQPERLFGEVEADAMFAQLARTHVQFEGTEAPHFAP